MSSKQSHLDNLLDEESVSDSIKNIWFYRNGGILSSIIYWNKLLVNQSANTITISKQLLKVFIERGNNGCLHFRTTISSGVLIFL